MESRHTLARAVRITAGALVCALALSSPEPAVAQVACQVSERASLSSAGVQGAGDAGTASISADGRIVAFVSAAADLVPGDTNGALDVFVRDRQTGGTGLVSVDSKGALANAGAAQPALSANGLCVSFDSTSDNLVAADTNLSRDAFLHDLATRLTERVSVATGGGEGNGNSFAGHPSGDGRFVVFWSDATNLVPGDTNTASDVFVRDRLTATTECVSVSSGGALGDGPSVGGRLSANGRYVVFASAATNLVAGDTNARFDVFVRDRQAGTTERVSVDSAGLQTTGPVLGSGDPVISADGRFVAFNSDAPDLVAGDTNAALDVFVHDRQTAATERVSVTSAGLQAAGDATAPLSTISADGRFVGFGSTAPDLVAGDTNAARDVFVRDRQTGTTQRLSLSTGGLQVPGGGSVPWMSANGQVVAFQSADPGLVAGDTNAAADVFIAGNCLAPTTAAILWLAPPPTAALGGAALPLQWNLSNFAGPISANQAHFGITSVLGSSPAQPPTNGTHAHSFSAPNIGTFDSPRTFSYVVRALDNITQVLSPFRQTVVTAGATPPTVGWVTPPPASVPSGGQFTAAWQLANFANPATVNAVGWGVTRLLGQTVDQPGSNGLYVETVTVPVVTNTGTLSYTAFAQNGIEFAFAPIVPVTIEVGGACTLQVTSPNGGETWTAGTQATLTWSGTTGVAEPLVVSLWKAGVWQRHIRFDAPNTGSLTWTVPAGTPPGTDYTVSVGNQGGTCFDFSDANFTIAGTAGVCSLQVASPNGGETWTAGTQATITWTGTTPVAEPLVVSLWKGGVWQRHIRFDAPNTGSLTWTVPAGTTPGTDYTVSVGNQGGTCFDFSDANFTIL